MAQDLDEFELAARRGKYRQIRDAQASDEARVAQIAEVDAARQVRIGEALGFLDTFKASGDADAFASAMEHWCRLPGFPAFVGPNGQMFLKQLLKAGDGEGASILREVLYAPTSDDDACARLTRVLAFIDTVKQGGHPAPARAPFLLSFFWALQDGARWPVAWASATKSLYNLGWIQPGHDHAENYREFASVMRSLGDPLEVAHALFWFDKHRFVGLDPALVDRCTRSWDLAQSAVTGRYSTDAVRLDASYNAIALIYETWLALSGLQPRISEVLDSPVKLSFAKVKTGAHLYRWWGWASATPEGGNASLRLWVTRDGVFVGVHPGWARDGWYAEAAEIAASNLPAGYEMREVRGADAGRLGPPMTGQPSIEFLAGRFFEGTSALGRTGFAEDLLAVGRDLRPMLDRLQTAAKAVGATKTPPRGRPIPTEVATGASDLGALVAEFRQGRPYPTPKDAQSTEQRAAWAEQLSPTELETADLGLMRQIINTGRYGGPGPQSVLNATLGSLDAEGIQQFFACINELLWSTDPLEVRIDAALASGFKGLGESVIMKLLAIAHPDRVVPVFPFAGDMGKGKLMQLLGLSPPDASGSRGQKQIASNDAIRDVLFPHFPDDPWGQCQFLYWLRTRPLVETQDDGDALGALASELYLPAEALDDWVALLREKGQIIFYGPPGTGKTFVARRLAEVLTAESSRRSLVQFHPSTSYEDFFEGYRPETTAEGALGYRLVPGPLARLAAMADAAPGVDHIMVIDEINRANLPKVFGELLFLLEYRDEQVQTLYRPDDAFELPRNLYFIGTMNTADKSIALIDAALRRRFHFVPFFPHEEPHSQVLAKWLADHNPDASWVAGLIEHVNSRLMEILGGPHLQIGPSHFFDPDLDEKKVRMIWRYSIEPFIEDQIWGQTDLLQTFEFDTVLKAYRSAGGDAPAATDDQTVLEPEA